MTATDLGMSSKLFTKPMILLSGESLPAVWSMNWLDTATSRECSSLMTYLTAVALLAVLPKKLGSSSDGSLIKPFSSSQAMDFSAVL